MEECRRRRREHPSDGFAIWRRGADAAAESGRTVRLRTVLAVENIEEEEKVGVVAVEHDDGGFLGRARDMEIHGRFCFGARRT